MDRGCLLLGACLTGHGQVTIRLTFDGLDVAIPDGDSLGVANTQSVSSSFDRIESLRVTLGIEGTGSGAFNGDLHVSLSHESGFAVLLGRTGRRSDNLFGYGDNGFDVTFDDSAANGDIHNYRVTLNGNHQTAISGPLTGLWAPDGRVPEDPSNPEQILDTTPRIGLLERFVGLDPNGSWTLFLVDYETGGTSGLTSWGLEITVPEPHSWGLTGLALFAFAAWRRGMRKPIPPPLDRG
ncbi:MAG: PEP-CTERM sorting domain-containing protein [Chloroflexi bacterium]|nr:PEP-CTERM sorting domain-containing protein [Chloroflexota bacterium]